LISRGMSESPRVNDPRGSSVVSGEGVGIKVTGEIKVTVDNSGFKASLRTLVAEAVGSADVRRSIARSLVEREGFLTS